MRIALITPVSPLAPTAPASERRRALQAPSLALALANLGHRVTVYARRDQPALPGTAILGPRVTVEHITAGPPGPVADDDLAIHAPEFASMIAERWRTRRPDVAHAFGWVSGLAALSAARGVDFPVAVTLGSLGVTEQRYVADQAIAEARLRLEPAIARSASIALASSNDQAAWLARVGVRKSLIKIVPSGVDVEQFNPDGPRLDDNHDERVTRQTRVRLVAAGGVGEAIGLDIAIRALADLQDAELVIVGGPDGRHLPRSGAYRQLATLATKLGVRRRVTFAGEQRPRDLAALLRSAALMVSAGPYDPSGTTVLEAMACGLPIVTATAGAHCDAVIDGTTGVVVREARPRPLAAALRRLLQTPALLQAYGIAAADRAKSRYSWERIGRETVAAYSSCIPAMQNAKAEQLEVADVDYLELPVVCATSDVSGRRTRAPHI